MKNTQDPELDLYAAIVSVSETIDKLRQQLMEISIKEAEILRQSIKEKELK